MNKLTEQILKDLDNVDVWKTGGCINPEVFINTKKNYILEYSAWITSKVPRRTTIKVKTFNTIKFSPEDSDKIYDKIQSIERKANENRWKCIHDEELQRLKQIFPEI